MAENNDEKKELPATEEVKKSEKVTAEQKKPPAVKALLFGKYDYLDVEIEDKGLARYINLEPVVVPHSGGRHSKKRFGKAKNNVVERLVNGMMRTEKYTGKKTKSYKIVRSAFEIIETKTKSNPLQVFIRALENAAPREEITRLRFGGINVPRAVDISPVRRLDIALRNLCKGAVASSHKNRKPAEECLADEIIMAAKRDMNSYSIAKKEEMERVAVSAR